MKLRDILMALIFVGSFSLGVFCNEPIRKAKGYFHYKVAQGFYEYPYNLKIRIEENINGELETFLVNTETNEYYKIGTKLYVGDYRHRIMSVLHIPKEILDENLKLKSFLRFYRSFL